MSTTTKKWVARKQFSIFEDVFYPGDEVPITALQRMPGDFKKLARAGWMTEVESDDA